MYDMLIMDYDDPLSNDSEFCPDCSFISQEIKTFSNVEESLLKHQAMDLRLHIFDVVFDIKYTLQLCFDCLDILEDLEFEPIRINVHYWQPPVHSATLLIDERTISHSMHKQCLEICK